MTFAEFLALLKRLKVVQGVKRISDFGITIPLIVRAKAKAEMLKLVGTTIEYEDVEWEVVFQPEGTQYTDKRTGLPKSSRRDQFGISCELSSSIDDLADSMSG